MNLDKFIEVEAYFISINKPNQSDIENWLEAEKIITTNHKKYKDIMEVETNKQCNESKQKVRFTLG